MVDDVYRRVLSLRNPSLLLQHSLSQLCQLGNICARLTTWRSAPEYTILGWCGSRISWFGYGVREGFEAIRWCNSRESQKITWAVKGTKSTIENGTDTASVAGAYPSCPSWAGSQWGDSRHGGALEEGTTLGPYAEEDIAIMS